MATRQKPWEAAASKEAPAREQRGQNDTGVNTSAEAPLSSSLQASVGAVPPVPARKPDIGYSGYGSYGTNGNTLSGNGYGSMGTGISNGFGGGYGYNSGMGSYGSYGSFGGGYGYGGGYGGYGGGYGGYGSGYNRFGVPGMNGGNPNALQNSTAATFQLIESIVGAFGGFAQMLESTYMATHSSFFAMMSVAEQFGHLKQSLGSILGIFAVLRWSRALLAKLSGNRPQGAASSLTAESFARFQARGGNIMRPAARPSFKPLVIFLTAVFGFPYLLGKVIRAMANNQLQAATDADIDPTQLEFCRALYDFVPENPQIEIELNRGELAAVLSSTDPGGEPSQWWRVRTRDGRSGYVPASYVQVIPRQQPNPVLPEAPSIKFSEQSIVPFDK